MKLLTAFIIVASIAVLGGCKKDYPEDIPDWLKDKIKDLEKETKGQKNSCCATVTEKTMNDNQTFYSIYYDSNPNFNASFQLEIFTYSGDLACCFVQDLGILLECSSNIEADSCGIYGTVNYMINDYVSKRTIWKEKE